VLTPHVDTSAPDLSEVADGVFAYVQPDGGWCLNNAGIVVSDGGSLLVDTAATEARARRLRQTALDLGAGAPRAVVNTHSHGDHTNGNYLFPEALVIGHERTRAEMTEHWLHITRLWPDVAWGAIELAPPTVTFRERLTIHVGSTRLELIHAGPAHSTDDTVVWLPDHGVLFTGDITMMGVTPFCVLGSISGSREVIAQLRQLGARTIVPGHGPVAGPEVLDLTEEYLEWVQELARDGLRAGWSPIEAAQRAGTGRYDHLIDRERLVPNLHRAYSEARGEPPGAPIELETALRDMAELHGRFPICHA
jgi:cyclase